MIKGPLVLEMGLTPLQAHATGMFMILFTRLEPKSVLERVVRVCGEERMEWEMFDVSSLKLNIWTTSRH